MEEALLEVVHKAGLWRVVDGVLIVSSHRDLDAAVRAAESLAARRGGARVVVRSVPPSDPSRRLGGFGP